MQSSNRWLGEKRNQSGEHRRSLLAGVEPELKLLRVFMQMLSRNTHVSSLDASFKVLPEIFEVVNVGIAPDVFPQPVGNSGVLVALGRKIAVGHEFIRMNLRTLLDVCFNDGLQCGAFNIGNNFGHHVTIALKHSHDDRFAESSAATWAGTPPADNRLIDFHNTRQRPLAVNVLHVLADIVTHAPSRLVSYAKLPLQFFRGNTVARRSEEINCEEPELQRRAAVFKGRARCGVKMMPAPLASVSTLSLKPRPVGGAFAFWANVALAEAALKYVRKARFVVWKLLVKLEDCQTRFNFHVPNEA
jgi:hypothetical protein